MTLFFKKKKLLSPKLNQTVLDKIKEETNRKGIEQVLLIQLFYQKNGIGEVQVSFSNRLPSDLGFVRFEDKKNEEILAQGEFQYESGNIYFYPNVEIEWKLTPNKNIHKIQSNYKFSKSKLVFDKIDLDQLKPILSECFLREGVVSVFMDQNICQLELDELDIEKESRISDVLLTYFSSLYLNPLKESHHHL